MLGVGVALGKLGDVCGIGCAGGRGSLCGAVGVKESSSSPGNGTARCCIEMGVM